MKPNFALDLSHEGIGLLHRGRSGWLFVGEVALDDPDLGGALNLLRKTATGLSQAGLSTKLLIPSSQILYTTVRAPGPDPASRRMQIAAALEGRTPYPVTDLVFDWSGDGEDVQVAVIARETLDEAEAFAVDHRFNPVCFASTPPEGVFKGEPFFGQTAYAVTILTDDEVEPDDGTVVVTGRADPDSLSAADAPPEPPRKQAPNPAPRIDAGNEWDLDQEAEAALSAALTDASETVSEPVGRAMDVAPDRDGAKQDEPKTENTTSAATGQAVAFASRRTTGGGTAELPAASVPDPVPDVPDPGTLAEKPKTGAPLVGFSSRRSENVAGTRAEPPLRAAKPNDDDALPPPPKPVLKAEAHLASDEAEAAVADPAPDDAVAAPAVVAPISAPEAAPAASLDVAPIATDVPPRHDPVDGAGTAQLAATPRMVSASKIAASFASNGADKLKTAGLGLGRSFLRTASVAKPKPRAPRPADREAEALTVFGARNDQRQRSNRMGLLLTLVLILVLAAIAIWSSFFLSDTVARFFSAPRGAVETAEISTEPTRTAPVAELPGPQEQEASNSAPGTEDIPVVANTDEAVQIATLTPFEDTDLLDFEPELPGEITDTPVDGIGTEGEVLAPPVARLPTPAEAQEMYLATGIWQLAPAQAPVPDEIEIANIYVASIDPSVLTQDAIALPAPGGARTDHRPLSPVTPLPFDTRFDYDDSGFVRATPDGAVTPEGALVIAGRPDPLPLERPTTNLPLPDRQQLAAVKPLPRPSNFGDTVERGRLGGLTRSELASVKPILRPRSAQEAATDAGLDESPTQYAVLTTAMPKTRPGNFSATVENARAAGIKPQSDPTSAVPTAPAIPTRASVAKQATETNAISLKKVTLIGVYGSASSRRALVRLPSGRYVKVEVGDRVDGGRVAAIDTHSLRYTKGGKSILLKMPKG